MTINLKRYHGWASAIQPDLSFVPLPVLEFTCYHCAKITRVLAQKVVDAEVEMLQDRLCAYQTAAGAEIARLKARITRLENP